MDKVTDTTSACKAVDDTSDLERRLLDAELNHNEWRWGWLAEIRDALQRQRETIAELRRIAARAVVHEAACTYTYYAYTRDCDCGAIENAIRKEQTP